MAVAIVAVATSTPFADLMDVAPWPAGTAGVRDPAGSGEHTDHPRGNLAQEGGPFDAVARDSDRRESHLIPLFLATGHPKRQGFARIVNLSDRSGIVTITAIDDAGVEFPPVSFRLPAGAVHHFNSDDLEFGNASKLSGSTGRSTKGDWRLLLDTDLEIEALAYVRTTDGFLTSMNETGREWNAGKSHRIPMFNPASNQDQRSELRLINPADTPVDVTVFGWDDNGNLHSIRGTLSARVSETLTAVDLERGIAGWSGRLGNGEGKWRLQADANAPIHVMGLLADPGGYLTNLSVDYRYNAGSTGTSTTGGRIRLFKSASHPSQQGFLRIINYSDVDGIVTLVGLDDDGVETGPVTVHLPAHGARHVNSNDLEFGNADKLTGAIGSPFSGDWRLLLESDLSVTALSYVRTQDGFLTSLNEHVTIDGGWHYVPTFNPASNLQQRSVLRLDNVQDQSIDVSIRGIDDDGRPSVSSVTGTLSANSTITLTAQELEAGPDGWSGSLGDGSGKWRLLIPSRGFFTMSLLEDPRGYLTSLSTSRIPSGGVSAVVSRLPPPAEPSVGLLRSNVDAYTSTTADFTLDIFAVSADSKLLSLDSGDIEIGSFEGSGGSTFNFQQNSVREQGQTSLGPYSATFLFDQSGSITGTDPHDARIAAARIFLDNLSSGDEVALLAFASSGNLAYEPVTAYQDGAGNAFTVDPNGFDAALANLADSEGGGTPLYESIVIAVNYTEQNANNDNRAVLIFTDGQNTDSGSSLEDAINASINRGIPLHTIALSAGVDLRVLSRLAGETEGSLTRATNAGSLISYYGALGPFLSGSSRFYRTKWRVTLSGGQDGFRPGAWFQTGVLVALPGGVRYLPFRIDF